MDGHGKSPHKSMSLTEYSLQQVSLDRDRGWQRVDLPVGRLWQGRLHQVDKDPTATEASFFQPSRFCKREPRRSFDTKALDGRVHADQHLNIDQLALAALRPSSIARSSVLNPTGVVHPTVEKDLRSPTAPTSSSLDDTYASLHDGVMFVFAPVVTLCSLLDSISFPEPGLGFRRVVDWSLALVYGLLFLKESDGSLPIVSSSSLFITKSEEAKIFAGGREAAHDPTQSGSYEDAKADSGLFSAVFPPLIRGSPGACFDFDLDGEAEDGSKSRLEYKERQQVLSVAMLMREMATGGCSVLFHDGHETALRDVSDGDGASKDQVKSKGTRNEPNPLMHLEKLNEVDRLVKDCFQDENFSLKTLGEQLEQLCQSQAYVRDQSTLPNGWWLLASTAQGMPTDDCKEGVSVLNRDRPLEQGADVFTQLKSSAQDDCSLCDSDSCKEPRQRIRAENSKANKLSFATSSASGSMTSSMTSSTTNSSTNSTTSSRKPESEKLVFEFERTGQSGMRRKTARRRRGSSLIKSTTSLTTGSTTSLTTGSTTSLTTGSTTSLTTGSTTRLTTGSTTSLMTGSTTSLTTGSTTSLTTGLTTSLTTGSPTSSTGITIKSTASSTLNLTTSSTKPEHNKLVFEVGKDALAKAAYEEKMLSKAVVGNSTGTTTVSKGKVLSEKAHNLGKPNEKAASQKTLTPLFGPASLSSQPSAGGISKVPPSIAQMPAQDEWKPTIKVKHPLCAKPDQLVTGISSPIAQATFSPPASTGLPLINNCWVQKQPMPVEKWGGRAVTCQHWLVLVGGGVGQLACTRVFAFNAIQQQWCQWPDTVYPESAPASDDSLIYVAGGRPRTTKVFSLKPPLPGETTSWKPVSDMIYAVQNGVAVFHRGFLFILCRTSFQFYNPKDELWRPLTLPLHTYESPLFKHQFRYSLLSEFSEVPSCLVAVGSRLITDAGWFFDVDELQWYKHSFSTYGCSMVNYKDWLVILGGLDATQKSTNQVLALDHNGHKWQSLPTLLFPRTFASIAVHCGVIYVIGGYWQDSLGQRYGLSSVECLW